MDTTTDKDLAVEQLAKEIGLEYQVSFVAKEQPADKVKHPRLNWLVTLTRNRRSMTTEYHEGCAFVEGYKQYHKTAYDKRCHDAYIRKVCETGHHWKYMDSLDYRSKLPSKAQPKPRLAAVLYCLLTDALAIEYGTFEEWAMEYGYEQDSREAERIYRKCVKIGLELRAIMGEGTMTRFRELLQDY